MSIFRNLQRKNKDTLKGYIDELTSLKTRIANLPQQYPHKGLVFGAGAAQAQQQIPIICTNIEQAISALQTRRDPHGNPITPAQVGGGLGQLVQATRKPGFSGLVSTVLSIDGGIQELEKCMDELGMIATRLGQV